MRYIAAKKMSDNYARTAFVGVPRFALKGLGLVFCFTVLALFSASDSSSEPTATHADLKAGLQLMKNGRLEEALGAFTRAENSSITNGQVRYRIQSLILRAEANEQLGYLLKAKDDAKKAKGLAKRLNLVRTEAIASIALGRLDFLLGNSKQAKKLLRTAMHTAKLLRNRAMQTNILNDLGVVYLKEGKSNKASKLFRRAVSLASTDALRSFKIKSLANLAQALSQIKGREARALKVLEQTYRTTRKNQYSRGEAAELQRVGALAFKIASRNNLSLDAKNRARLISKTLFTRLRRIARKSRTSRQLSYANGYLGLLAELRGRKNSAARYATAALLAAENLHAPEITHKWHWLLARIRRANNELAAAKSHYQRAIADIGVLRSDLSTDARTQRQAFAKILNPLFREFAEVLLTQAKTTKSKTNRTAILAEARNVIEILKSVELEDFFGDPCVTTLKSKEVAVDGLPPRTAALYPVLLKDRLELILSLPSGALIQRTVQISGAELEADANAFRSKIVNRASYGFMVHARKLYKILFEPISTALARERITTIVFVPDGVLRTIPLAGLNRDGTINGYLINHYAFAVTPGLKLLDPKTLKRKDPKVLSLGLTTGVQNFASLPFVKEELATIAGLFETSAIRDSSFTEERLRAEFKKTPYQIVHMATHGEFFPETEKSFLLTYNGKMTMSELEALIKFSRFRDQPVELLTLSACRTAVGNDRAALGLAGIAVKSGARSVMATLWYVEDRSTATLTSEFYRLLKRTGEGVSKAELLRRAQKKLLRNTSSRHPAFWAPFIMIGNWR